MTRDIFVIGTRGLAKEMALLIHEVNQDRKIWNFGGYVGNIADCNGLKLPFGEVISNDDRFLEEGHNADIVIGIGHPLIRRKVANRYCEHQGRLRFPNLIHPKVSLNHDFVALGQGNTITQGCVLTVDITIGNFNLLNWQSTIGHDVRIGDFNVINPGSNISGNVVIGSCNLIGTGTQILENKSVGDSCVIGAGSVVTKNVISETTVVGVPAKSMVKLSRNS